MACDFDQRILYVNATFPGSFHDTHCWETSNLHEAFALNNRLQGNHLIGDNGYPLSPWLIIPFSPMQLATCTAAERAWNKCFIWARLVAELCLGRWKGCWRAISKLGSGVVKRQPLQCMELVNATTVLHNIAIDAGCSAYSAINNPDPDFEPQPRRQAIRWFARARAVVNRDGQPQRIPLT